MNVNWLFGFSLTSDISAISLKHLRPISLLICEWCTSWKKSFTWCLQISRSDIWDNKKYHNTMFLRHLFRDGKEMTETSSTRFHYRYLYNIEHWRFYANQKQISSWYLNERSPNISAAAIRDYRFGDILVISYMDVFTQIKNKYLHDMWTTGHQTS